MDTNAHSTGVAGFLPVQTGNVPVTMSSREIAELVDSRHDKVKQSIERLAERGVIQLPPLGDVKNHLGQTVQEYRIGERESYIVVAQLSPEFTAKLVDFWQAQRNQPRSLPTTAEAFASAFQMIVEQERRQAAQMAELKVIGERVDQMAQAHTILDKLPSDCEYITVIRKRMNTRYGLSAEVVDKVMRDSPYAPTTRALVRNQHVEAAGAHNQGFSKKEVSAIFKRFVDECEQVTPTMFTHPFIAGRFKMHPNASGLLV